MSAIASVPLSDGTTIPQIGYGVFKIPDHETDGAVTDALEAGYRHIDTAAIYGNEAGVGRAIATSALRREDLYVTTKLWHSGFGDPRAALSASLEALGLDRVDLYLIHWPLPATEAYLDAWQALVALQGEGLTRSIGVSNFLPEQLERIAALGGPMPVANQIELHPHLSNTPSVTANAARGIVTEAWGPLGQGTALSDPVIADIAAAHGVGTAQAILRWHIQHGRIAIPKSITPARIAANADVFSFALTPEDMSRIDALDRGEDGRLGPYPSDYNG